MLKRKPDVWVKTSQCRNGRREGRASYARPPRILLARNSEATLSRSHYQNNTGTAPTISTNCHYFFYFYSANKRRNIGATKTKNALNESIDILLLLRIIFIKHIFYFVSHTAFAVFTLHLCITSSGLSLTYGLQDKMVLVNHRPKQLGVLGFLPTLSFCSFLRGVAVVSIVVAVVFYSRMKLVVRDTTTVSFLKGSQRKQPVPLYELDYPFRLLCTTEPRMLTWGSYKIRCEQLKWFANLYVPQLKVVTGYAQNISGDFNATIVVKSRMLKNEARYGKIYLDVIDNIGLHNESLVPLFYEVIVQNKFQAELFPNRKTHIINHWFNSYGADLGNYPDVQLPEVRSVSTLRVVSIWSPLPGENVYFSPKGISDTHYQRIEESFDIQKWFRKYQDYSYSQDKVNQIASDPDLGPAYLYQLLFRQYDVLVVYAKTGFKMTYNSYQRIVSQMRSGIPVLLDCRGKNHGDFCKSYSYPCVFEDQESFTDMLEKMKRPELRRECQQKGMEITSKYTHITHLLHYKTGYPDQISPNSCPLLPYFPRNQCVRPNVIDFTAHFTPKSILLRYLQELDIAPVPVHATGI